MVEFLRSLRPHQWIKNLLVFAPLVFAKQMFIPEKTLLAFLAFLSFCLISSGIYLLNDLLDLEADRNHPEKKHRPLASGRLSPLVAWVSMGTFSLAGLLIGFIPEDRFFLYPLIYWIINLLYSLTLKHMVVLDAMCVAIGFLLRVYTGGEAVSVEVSSWLVLCTFFVAMLLAFCKRRHEISLLGDGSGDHRKALEAYSLAFLDQMIAPLGALTVMSYALYTTSRRTVENFGTENLVYTVPFVMYGVFRYLYLVHRRAEGGNPTLLLLKDRMLLLNILLWFGTSVWIVYG